MQLKNFVYKENFLFVFFFYLGLASARLFTTRPLLQQVNLTLISLTLEPAMILPIRHNMDVQYQNTTL